MLLFPRRENSSEAHLPTRSATRPASHKVLCQPALVQPVSQPEYLPASVPYFEVMIREEIGVVGEVNSGRVAAWTKPR